MSMLEIVYEDEHYVVIDKPAGLLVHRSWIASEAREFALQMLRDQIGQRVYPVHRLDRPTSGLLVFARSAAAAQRLADAFAERRVHKVYHAVVRGYAPAEGEIDYALKEELDKIADAQADQDKPAQPAYTQFRCLAQVELPVAVGKRYATSRYSLVELHPRTGRKHQLRRHLAHIRHPIIGDANHGDNRHNRFFRDELEIRRLLLAATGLAFTQPYSGELIELKLALPRELRWLFSEEARTTARPCGINPLPEAAR